MTDNLPEALKLLLAKNVAPVYCKVCRKNPVRLAGKTDFNRVGVTPPPLSVAGIHVSYWQCGNCGFAWAPVFDTWDDALFSQFIYNEDIRLIETEENARQRCANVDSLLQGWFADYPAATRFLDYGCGPGLLVESRKRAGFDATGYDRFQPAFNRRPDGKFDVVTCFEVMEHLNLIETTIDDILSFLAPEGILILGTVLVDRPMNVDWWYCSPRSGHISFWTFPALSTVFNKRKLNVASDGKLFSFVFSDAAKPKIANMFGQKP